MKKHCQELQWNHSQMVSKFRSSAEESPHLPHEIIEQEMLPRLPVKSLLRFRCVSKSWGSLIGSKIFINKHLRNSKSNRTYWKAIFKCATPGRKQCSTIHDPTNNHLMTTGRVVGNCNGLLCIHRYLSIFLWNPTTRICIKLPKLEAVATKLGLGWDEESDAYKVFAHVPSRIPFQSIGKVYSSKTNSWKTVEHGNLKLYNRELGVFACGKIHWLVQIGKYIYIEYLELKSEVFGKIELPCKPEFALQLRERRGCLSVAVDNRRSNVEVWVMRKHGVKESWVKTSAAHLPLHYGSTYAFCKLDAKEKGVKFWPRECDEGYFCVESLVSPLTAQQKQVHVSVAEGRARRLNRRRPARYDT